MCLAILQSEHGKEFLFAFHPFFTIDRAGTRTGRRRALGAVVGPASEGFGRLGSGSSGQGEGPRRPAWRSQRQPEAQPARPGRQPGRQRRRLACWACRAGSSGRSPPRLAPALARRCSAAARGRGWRWLGMVPAGRPAMAASSRTAGSGGREREGEGRK